MKVLAKVLGVIWVIINLLLYWIFLPIFILVGFIYQVMGKIPPSRERRRGNVDADFLERLEFKFDEDEWKWVESIIENLREKGYGTNELLKK